MDASIKDLPQARHSEWQHVLSPGFVSGVPRNRIRGGSPRMRNFAKFSLFCKCGPTAPQGLKSGLAAPNAAKSRKSHRPAWCPDSGRSACTWPKPDGHKRTIFDVLV